LRSAAAQFTIAAAQPRAAAKDPHLMQIRVLGCSGSIAAGNRTTSFLVDDDMLIDAGTGVGDLTLDELSRIERIFLSHSHLDHVLSVGLLADSVVRRRIARRCPPIAVHALPATIDALRTHVFNGVIWPDFSRLPDEHHPMLEFVPIAVGQVLDFGTRRIEVLPAMHTVPAVGFALSAAAPSPQPAWVFSGDTGPNPALWQRLACMPVAALVIETAFSDEEIELARISRHLCPALLRDELARLERPVDVYITHIKPGELDAVMSEIGAQASRHRIRALAAGQVMRVGSVP
jgi:ribonuclease BN (tRNA processing enzyme)